MQALKWIILMSAVLAAFDACAEGEVLKRIKTAGSVNIGYNADQFPFSYEGADGKPIGYSIEICRRIVAAMQSRLGKDPIELRFVPVARGNRVTMVANGTIDLYCALTTENASRDTQADFLDPIFIDNTRVVVKRGSNLRVVVDLSNKRLALVTGTSNMQIAMALKKERRLLFDIIPAQDVAEAMRMLSSGEADGFMAGDSVLAAAIARSSKPDDFRILPESLLKRPRSIVVPPNEPEFRDAANSALRAMAKSGELEKLYARWFESPIEPGHVNLKLPMSDALRSYLAQVKRQ